MKSSSRPKKRPDDPKQAAAFRKAARELGGDQSEQTRSGQHVRFSRRLYRYTRLTLTARGGCCTTPKPARIKTARKVYCFFGNGPWPTQKTKICRRNTKHDTERGWCHENARGTMEAKSGWAT